jgi:ESCRT-I complex subunit VPS37
VTEIQEDVEYRVEFSAGGYSMAIQVSLCPEFPRKRPVLKVSPQIDHPWVDEQSEIISAPGLLNVSSSFTEMLHSDSGSVWSHNSGFLVCSSLFTLIWVVLCRQ